MPLRRTRILFVWFTVLAGFCPPGLSLARPEASPEPWRALWVVRDHLASPTSVAQLVEDAATLGATDLLVQVRGRGDACYRSRLEPPAAFLRRFVAEDTLTWDPLADLLDRAHARGLRVHAWCNVFLAWSDRGAPPKGHVLARHPAWALVLGDGRSSLELAPSQRRERMLEGAWLSPGLPEARTYCLDVASDLVARYPLDGIHWDYVRYPEAEGGFEALESYEAVRIEYELDTDRPGDPWSRWREDQVSLFVSSASARLRTLRPGLEISAAVFPDPFEARRAVHQDWVRWLEAGWIDRALPMAYTASEARLADWATRWSVATPSRLHRIVPGLGVFRTNAEGLDAQLAVAGAALPAGVALFSLRDVTANDAVREVVRLRWMAPAPDPPQGAVVR